MRDHLVVVVTTTPHLAESTRATASKLAARTNAVLMFLHVIPLSSGDGEAMMLSAARLSDTRERSWLQRQLPTDAAVRYRHRLEVGEPEEVVRRFVEARAVDMVVVEEPPRSWLSSLLTRGFADRLIRELDCPVLVGGPRFLERRATVKRRRQQRELRLSTLEKLDLLNGLLDARVDALQSWMRQLSEVTAEVAGCDVVKMLPTARRQGGVTFKRAVRRLGVEIEERARALRAIHWQLDCGSQSWGTFQSKPLPSPALHSFAERIAACGRSTSLPLALDPELDRLVVLAGAQERAHDDDVSLVFAFDAETDFLRILGQPGPLPSFETYAFDETGLMLSNSRFLEHLQQSGLLPEAKTGVQTPLRLRVAEPSEGPADSWPLTRMARRAVRHEDGFDTRGYPDYRGVRVIGAWRWVEEYGFGVSAEVDECPPHSAAAGRLW